MEPIGSRAGAVRLRRPRLRCPRHRRLRRQVRARRTEGRAGRAGPLRLVRGAPDVSDTQIGALGLSLGGGEVWNAAVAGVPFKAIVPAITWTTSGPRSIRTASRRPGCSASSRRPCRCSRWDPALAQAAQDLIQGQRDAAVTSAEAARSSRSQLHALTVPTLLLQGRHDFLFDMDQAIAAWKLLAGPKRLYLGDLGHAPAKNPAAEQPTTSARPSAGSPLPRRRAETPAAASSSRTIRGTGRGVYKRLPETRRRASTSPGRNGSRGQRVASRSVRLTGGPHETFGDSSSPSTTRQRAPGHTSWRWSPSRDVATPVTEGGARSSPSPAS